jgi:hypothetical protein
MNEAVKSISDMIGDPKLLDAEMESYRRDVDVLWSHFAELAAKYPKQWVAVYNGKVQASAPNLDRLLVAVAELGLPRERIAVRYMDTTPRRMVL